MTAIGKSQQPLRVLIVDDSEADAASLSRMLHVHFGRDTRIHEVETAAEALALARQQPIDVALIDYRLPDRSGLELVEHLHVAAPAAAAIMLTGQGNERVAVEAIRRGASDYLVKDELTAPSLGSVVTQAVEHAQQEAAERRSVQQLRRRTDELDHFVRSLSHDMSANFMMLEHSFHELKESCADQHRADLAAGVSHVEACLRESKRFVEDLVNLARTGIVQMEPSRVDLNRVVQETASELETLLAERGVSLQIVGSLPVVWCNEVRLRQVVTNLVRNAVRHGCDASDPQITIAQQSAPSRPLSPAFVAVSVHDNGPGIPAAAREQIFLPGRRLPTAHPEGTGMGLAIVQRIVQHYGGAAYVDDCSQGTSFVFTLPAADSAPQ